MPGKDVTTKRLIDCVEPGDTVWILSRFGVEHKGKAVMRSSMPDTWVLNMGGRHGRPGLASDKNVTRVIKPKKDRRNHATL